VPASLADVWWLAAAGAVVATLVHVASVEFRFRVLHLYTWTNREFAWLALVGYLITFVVFAAPVAVLVVALRRWLGLRVAATALTALTAFSILLLYQKVHPIAQVILALGVGAHLGGLVAAAPLRWLRRARRVAVGGGLVLGGLGLLAFAGPRLGRGAASPPPAGAPNILLLILDTVRAANLGLYGHSHPTTPVLDRLADESTVFEHAFVVAPWSAPSHASMLTGVWASQTGADYLHPMYDSLPTVAEVLRRRGYATGGFTANTGFAGYQVGLSRGFDRYEDFPFTFHQALWSTTLAQTGSGHLILEGVLYGERWKVRHAITHPDLRTTTVRRSVHQPAVEIATNFLSWREAVGERPYFAMLNFMDAHAPYDPPDGFRTRFNEGLREVDRYDGAIAYTDSIIGELLDQLRHRGELERTVVIVTSDHGEHWGEHDLESHGNSLYLPLLRVPLLIHAPGQVPGGQRIDRVISLRDLAATMVDLAGAEGGSLPGVSLAPVARQQPGAEASPVLAEAAMAVNPGSRNLTRDGPIKATLDSAWHYIRYGNGREELFAWRLDPEELENRAATEEGRAVIPQHRQLVGRLLGTGWPPPRSRLH
jgi:arylsulfatase A-like enzyme